MYSLDNEEVLNRCRKDNDFLGEVILKNEELIWFIINKYCGNPDELVKISRIGKDDLLQQGRIALINSINSFDASKGTKFSTLAAVAIQREVGNYLRDKASVVRRSRSAYILMIKIKQIEEVIGYLPDPRKLAEMLDEKEQEIIKVLSIGQDEKFADDSVLEYSKSYSFEGELIEDECFDDYVNQLLPNFNEEEKQVFLMMIEGKSQTEIAVKLGKSKNTIKKRVDFIRDTVSTYAEREKIRENWSL